MSENVKSYWWCDSGDQVTFGEIALTRNGKEPEHKHNGNEHCKWNGPFTDISECRFDAIKFYDKSTQKCRESIMNIVSGKSNSITGKFLKSV